MSQLRPRRLDGWVAVAAVAGLLHALSSAYWAAGGTALLQTVGTWAEEWVASEPVAARLVLAAIAAAKLLLAVAPAVLRGRLSRGEVPRSVRSVGWVVSGTIALYGVVNTVGANLVLAGAVSASPDATDAALRGHAYLWDPLFAVWGAALMMVLWTSRRAAVR
jgi:hypothetical protein